jgi:hypothetical protein
MAHGVMSWTAVGSRVSCNDTIYDHMTREITKIRQGMIKGLKVHKSLPFSSIDLFL